MKAEMYPWKDERGAADWFIDKMKKSVIQKRPDSRTEKKEYNARMAARRELLKQQARELKARFAI